MIFLITDEGPYLEYAVKFGTIPEVLVGNDVYEWELKGDGYSYFAAERKNGLINAGNWGWCFREDELPFNGNIAELTWTSFHKDYPRFMEILEKDQEIYVNDYVVTRYRATGVNKRVVHRISVLHKDAFELETMRHWSGYPEYQTNIVEQIRGAIPIIFWRQFLDKYEKSTT